MQAMFIGYILASLPNIPTASRLTFRAGQSYAPNVSAISAAAPPRCPNPAAFSRAPAHYARPRGKTFCMYAGGRVGAREYCTEQVAAHARIMRAPARESPESRILNSPNY